MLRLRRRADIHNLRYSSRTRDKHKEAYTCQGRQKTPGVHGDEVLKNNETAKIHHLLFGR